MAHPDQTSSSKTWSKDLANFFDSSPTLLVPHENHTTSKGTRRPAQYDMHMREDLILHKVELLPNLQTEILSVLDRFVHKANNLPVLNDDFPGPAKLCDQDGGRFRSIYNEDGVADAYKERVGLFCSTVASTLLFDQPWAYSSLLHFSKHFRQKHGNSTAIADGFLHCGLADSEEELHDLTFLSPELRAEWGRLFSQGAIPFMIWEFKSLIAGDATVMKEIKKLASAPIFPWISCQPALGTFCGRSSGHVDQEGVYIRSGRPNGFDAVDTPWKLPTFATSNSSPCPAILPLPENTLSAASNFPSFGAVHSKPPSRTNSHTSSSMSSTRTQITNKSLPAYKSSEYVHVHDCSSIQGLPAIIEEDEETKAAKFWQPLPDCTTSADGQSVDESISLDTNTLVDMEADEDEDKVQSPSRSSGKESSETEQMRAIHILQQAWAETVKNDCTLIVIHSGNLEYIGVRHRGTQTLYLSELIHVPNCPQGYRKLHTALYIAAYLDAVERTRLNGALGHDQGLGLTLSDPHLDNESSLSPEIMAAQRGKKRLAVAASRDRLVHLDAFLLDCLAERKFLNIDHGKYLGRGTLSYARYTSRPAPVHIRKDARPVIGQARFLLRITDEVSPRVFFAKVICHSKPGSENPDPEVSRGKVTLKFAETDEEVTRLYSEYQMYTHLHDAGTEGILPVYGFFGCHAPGGENRFVLAVGWGGKRVDHTPHLHVKGNMKELLFRQIYNGLLQAGVQHAAFKEDHMLLDGDSAWVISLHNCVTAHSKPSLEWLMMNQDKTQKVLERISMENGRPFQKRRKKDPQASHTSSAKVGKKGQVSSRKRVATGALAADLKRKVEMEWHRVLEHYNNAKEDHKTDCARQIAAGMRRKDLPKVPTRPLKRDVQARVLASTTKKVG